MTTLLSTAPSHSLILVKLRGSTLKSLLRTLSKSKHRLASCQSWKINCEEHFICFEWPGDTVLDILQRRQFKVHVPLCVCLSLIQISCVLLKSLRIRKWRVSLSSASEAWRRLILICPSRVLISCFRHAPKSGDFLELFSGGAVCENENDVSASEWTLYPSATTRLNDPDICDRLIRPPRCILMSCSVLCDSEQEVDFTDLELLPPPPLYADAFWWPSAKAANFSKNDFFCFFINSYSGEKTWSWMSNEPTDVTV